jgi:hypothetical protein
VSERVQVTVTLEPGDRHNLADLPLGRTR